MELICLANSKKMSERCVAGLRIDNGQWVRPVSSADHGELTYRLRNLTADGEPQHFDLISVGLAKPKPTPGQPENWLIDRTPWRLIRRPAPNQLSALVAKAVLNEPLFGSPSDSIPECTFASSPAVRSLCLVKPSNMRWLTEEFGSKRTARAVFQAAGICYNLSVTDPPFEQKLKALSVGYHDSQELGINNSERILFTISLGEPFHGKCYKLVASVLSLPSDWPSI
jgi:hypothetical protein